MTMSTTKKVPLEIIDLVRQKKVLLAACALTVNECGNTTFNYTVPIFVQTYSFLTAKPSQLSRVLLFASPFTKEVRNSFFLNPSKQEYQIPRISPKSRNNNERINRTN